MKDYKQKIQETALSLITKNGSTTTLDIKTELRKLYPLEMWVQKVVSEVLDQYQDDVGLECLDNGTYRTYSFSINKVSRKKILKYINDLVTLPITLSWITKSGETRTYEGTINSDDYMTPTGYILFITEKGIKSVDTRTLQALKYKNITYTVKK